MNLRFFSYFSHSYQLAIRFLYLGCTCVLSFFCLLLLILLFCERSAFSYLRSLSNNQTRHIALSHIACTLCRMPAFVRTSHELAASHWTGPLPVKQPPFIQLLLHLPLLLFVPLHIIYSVTHIPIMITLSF